MGMGGGMPETKRDINKSTCVSVSLLILLIMFLSFLLGLHYVIASCGKRHNR